MSTQHRPDFDTFTHLAQDGRWVPVARRLVSDALTPVTAFHRLDRGACACLFESVVGGEKVGRYSFLTADPYLQMEARGNRVAIITAAGREEFDSPDPIEELK